MYTPDLPPVDPARLRAALRHGFELPDLDFAEAPRRLGAGGEAVVDAFRLRGVPEPLAGELVLRRLLPMKDPAQLRLERAVHTALAEQGFPVPRVLWVETGSEPVGAPFLVAERIPGEVLLEAVTRPTELARRLHLVPGLVFDALFRVPRLLAVTQASLHRLDPGRLGDRLADEGLSAAGVGFAARLEAVRALVAAAELHGLEPGLRWLDDQRPEAGSEVVCHGDLVFTNLCVLDGAVSGVFDWSTVTLAEPAYDVAATLARLDSRVPGMPAPLDWLSRSVQARLSRRYRATYEAHAERALDPDRLRYYEAYWLLSELARSGERLRAGAVPDGAIELRWLHAETIEVGVAAFRRRTGVQLAPRMPA